MMSGTGHLRVSLAEIKEILHSKSDTCMCCLGSSAGRAVCLEYRVLWVRVPPEAAFFRRKSDCLGCAVLLCLAVYLTGRIPVAGPHQASFPEWLGNEARPHPEVL